MKIHAFAILALLLALVSCSDQDKNATPSSTSTEEHQKIDKVSLVLNWFPEAEHGGFYAAQVHGFYHDEGLDVEIISGGVDVAVIPRVATGQTQFGIANADQVIFGRAEGAKIVSVLAPMQVSPRCIMVHEDSGIESLSDLKDMTLAINPNGAFAQYIQKNYPLKNVKIVPYPGNISVYLNDRKFGQQAYNISEPFVARKNGGDARVLMLSDAGFNPYTSCVIVSEDLIAKNPSLVQRFVHASARGWDQYLAAPAKTNQHIASLNADMGVDVLQFGVDQMQTMVYTNDTENGGTGTMTPDRWNTLLEQMEQLELVKPGAVKSSECFTTEFIPKD